MTATLITATVVKPPRQVDTKHGPRLVADLKTVEGEEVTLWKPTTDEAIAALQRGQSVHLVKDSKGFNLVAQTQQQPQQPTEQGLTPELKRQIAGYITQQADLLKFCRDIAIAKIGNVDEETIRCTTQTLYIAASRKFSL